MYITGFTASTNFPIANPLQPTFGGGIRDAFMAKLNAAGSTLIYSTYLGGNGAESGFNLTVDTGGNAYVTGNTSSTNFPIANPLQPTFGGPIDAFVTKLNAAGSSLIYSTYLGGGGEDFGFDITLDASGNLYVVGHTFSPSFPTANAMQPALAGPQDAFVTKMNAAGSALLYSTYLGGGGADVGSAITLGASGNVYVAGWTYSPDFPTANAVQPAFGGERDAFLAKIVDNQPPVCFSYAVSDQRHDDAQFFTIDIRDNTVSALGSPHLRHDIAGIDLHPVTNALYAASGSDGVRKGYLYTVDRQTGALTLIGPTGFREINGLSFRPTDSTLWGWAERTGLITIDIATGVGTLVFRSQRDIDGLAWNSDGTLLYAAEGRNLYRYDPGAKTLRRIAKNLPGHTEGLDMRPDGRLLGSIDSNRATSIFVYDVRTLKPVASESIATPYNHIESIAWPELCANQ
jgi:hypothetical protein